MDGVEELEKLRDAVIDELPKMTDGELKDSLAKCFAERGMLICSGQYAASDALRKLQEKIAEEIENRDILKGVEIYEDHL